ncbi:hypothetical protein Y1Q_0019776 [Alligator mississippiensis]|uniref:Uncharacterized protein n=1 Tax=Alligator mississippiensis TaxID=8496 RepID=A0A151PFB9_ALLMI|nr:hypothetical protein Y1Q_0019776 [Alligator mississippiensis]
MIPCLHAPAQSVQATDHGSAIALEQAARIAPGFEGPAILLMNLNTWAWLQRAKKKGSTYNASMQRNKSWVDGFHEFIIN